MESARIRQLLVGLSLAAAVSLSGCAADVSAQTALKAPAVAPANPYAAAGLQAASAKQGPGKGDKGDKGQPGKQEDKGKPGKGNGDDKPGKGNGNGNPGNGNGNDKPGKGNGNGNHGNGSNNPGNGQGDDQGANAPRPGLGNWWKDFTARLFGGNAAKVGGWQLGRFKDAFPFAYPPGWQVRERGDAVVANGEWQNGQYLFQLTRSVQIGSRSLEDWVGSDVQRLGMSANNVRYAQAGNVRIAVVTGVRDPEYSCPVAYVYLWTANPAGNNVRQAMGVVSQAPGAACNPAGLNAFVDQYLARLGAKDGSATATPAPTAAPTAVATARPTAAATAVAPTPAVSDWQQTRFFNAFSFAYPVGWTMDRLGDTAHLQGSYNGRSYVADMVWVRDAPQMGLEAWARADLQQLGVNMEGMRLDYAPQGNDAQIAIVSGIRLAGYDCPVVRMYVVANNAAAGGQRSYTVTVAQANGQSCDPQALENIAYQMVQQA